MSVLDSVIISLILPGDSNPRLLKKLQPDKYDYYSAMLDQSNGTDTDRMTITAPCSISLTGTDTDKNGISVIISLISNPGGFKPASTEVNLSPDKYRLLQRHARSV
ncbi:hypothetical protein CRE_24294 [Caenorhabditis remanei]|uniref:Uncharacterized protein n=1 Tax=Caenorhabditis remanei TaxID=31234 RepID=E3NLQ6_CAERE|nr:hypothetical protein CRE_24294 [Caenorhabditis remanei]